MVTLLYVHYMGSAKRPYGGLLFDQQQHIIEQRLVFAVQSLLSTISFFSSNLTYFSLTNDVQEKNLPT